MTERDIFLAAIELPDPVARAAYLETACAGNTALRASVEALLRSHDSAGSFLGRPAVAATDPDHAATRAFSADPDTEPARAGAPDPDEALGFLAPARRPDALGRIGHYEVLEVLGRGAFGIVFRAFDDTLQRVVAVKVLAPQMAMTSPARKRFLREARSAAQVRHENVVQTYAVEEAPLPFLVMEFIPGETLQGQLDRNGPLDVPEVVRIGRQLAEGLAAAHEKGLIHRDIKPANVLIEGGARRTVKITDFGLARAADDASISQSGVVAGTPMYMAPEQAKGEALDHRADLFSLGSVLYVMATGRPPFRASGTMAVLKRVCEEDPRPIREVIPEVPEWLCRVIEKLHAKNPDDRYQSAREVADVLADCEQQLQAHAVVKDFSRLPEAKPTPAQPRAARRRWKWAAAALALFAVCGIAAGLVYRSYEPAPGVVIIRTDDPEVVVTIDGQLVLMSFIHVPEGVTREHSASTTVGVSPGEHRVWVMKEGRMVYEETFTVGPGETKLIEFVRPKPAAPSPPAFPFDAATAKAHQTAWAKYLGVEVEVPNSIGMKLRLIPPGKFLMGSTKEEVDELISKPPASLIPSLQEILRTEVPQREVTIDKPFYLGSHEVTVGQFRQFVKEAGFQTRAELKGGGLSADSKEKKSVQDPANVWSNPQFAVSEQHAVVFISLEDADAFCAWLSKKEGRQYVIPREDQWEFACRAGTTTSWWCGNDIAELFKHELANLPHTGFHPVGASKKSNPFGLFDMHGNVTEWCLGAENEGVRRGDRTHTALTRSAARALRGPKDARFHHGFRVAIIGDLKPKSPPTKVEK